MRISSKVPLPPEMCLNDIDGADSLFRNRMFYTLLGVDGHPVIRMLESISVEAAMARTLTRASHLDRMAHYASWLGQEHVKVVDLHPEDLTAQQRDTAVDRPLGPKDDGPEDTPAMDRTEYDTGTVSEGPRTI